MAEWDTAYVNDLPDSAFAVILPGGKKDSGGKTTPRSLRKLPHHNATGGVDLPHLRNALARLSQTQLPAALKQRAESHLDRHAAAEGVGEDNATQEDLPMPTGEVDLQSLRGEHQGVLRTAQGRMPTLCLDAVSQPIVVQEPSDENGGVMRVRCPFFVGNSVSRASGIPLPIYWPEGLLQEIVQEGNAQIAEGKQPLTSYARHIHATSLSELPVGKVVGLTQEGRIGWAEHELYDVVPHGTNLKTLIRHKAINAASLRTRRYRFGEAKVNGENMLVAEKISLDGIDWAPDGPAQETFGIEVLHQEAVLEQTPPQPEPVIEPEPEPEPEPARTRQRSRRNLPANTNPDPQPLTLEEVRAYPDIVQEIERPFREQVATLTQELQEMRRLDALRLRDSRIAEIAAETPSPDAFREKLVTICDQEKVVDANGVNTIIAPLLLEELRRFKDSQEAAAPRKTAREELADLFRPSAVVHQEDPNAAPPPKPEPVTQERPRVLTVGGLELPEGF